MSKEPNGRELIEAFFAALNLRDIDACAAALTRLQSLARRQPTYEPWCVYLHGVLLNERDRDWAEAERIFKRLLLADLDPLLRGRVLLALGRTCEYLGQWEEAIRAYEETASLFARLDRPVDQAKAWKHIAISYRRGFNRGDFGLDALWTALEYCQSALDVLEPIEQPPPDVLWLIGSVWNTMGLINRLLGRWDEALACYRRDMAICRSLDDRFGLGLSYGNLGEIYQKRGRDNWPRALEAYRQALTIIREFDDRYEETEVLANLGFLHQKMGEYPQALRYYDQAIALIEELRAGLSSEEARADFFATIADTYANGVLLCLQMGANERAFDLVEQARSRAFLDALAARSSELAREVRAPLLTLADVQAALPPDAVLLEYFTTGLVEMPDSPRAPGRGPERHRFPPPGTLVFAVTRDGIRVYDAGISPNDLRPRQLDSVVERHFLRSEVRSTLYDRLIGPVEHLVRDKRRLYIAPHGPLHYVPFQALVAPDGETLLREEGPQLVYGPSATLLFSPAPKQPGQPDPTRASCLALGYDGADATRLRFAEEEAHRVARLTGGRALTGRSSKKEALFERARDYRLLHVSCHGKFNPDDPLSSSLSLAPEETLTALEVIEHLRLRCDLVCLSACESGLSRVRRGDELVGLMRAFMYAGASALVATLWRVDERSTLILMERFYREILAGAGFAEALRQAQLYLRSLTRFADPYYWAPFIIVGHRGPGPA